MSASRKAILNQLRDIIILIIAGFGMAYIFGYKNSRQFFLLSSFTVSMWVMLWKGNEAISRYISNRYSWTKSPLKNFFVAFIATITYTVGSVYSLVLIFEYFFHLTFSDVTGMLYGSVIVTLLITLFMYGRSFLLRWKEALLDGERLKRESVTAQYESLKNQVNPHFLFNSLNVLTNLVYENQDLAVRFIKQLSEVYRYVLDTRDREVVSKEEELQFLESYLFLQNIRFGKNLTVSIDLNNVKTIFPPLVLQMLVENAIKHNVISSDQPLHVSIQAANGYVEVSNNLQVKKLLNDESTNVGLTNINQRYEFLTNRKIEVVQTPEKFMVRLPMVESIEK